MADAKQSGKKPEKTVNEGRQYLEGMVNAANQKNVWRSVSGLLILLVFALLWAVIQTTKSLPTRLITYEMATGCNSVEVGPNGEGAKEYLGHIAEADLKLYTDWQPDTVEKRFRALSKRMTPELHAQQFVQFNQEADNYKKARFSQVFYVRDKKAIGNDRIRIAGVLIRYAGELQVLNTPVVYIMDYIWEDGVPGLQAVFPEDLKKQREDEKAAAEAAKKGAE